MCQGDGENVWNQYLDNVFMYMRNLTQKSINKSPIMALHGKIFELSLNQFEGILNHTNPKVYQQMKMTPKRGKVLKKSGGVQCSTQKRNYWKQQQK